jgi:hypothetical protein
LDAKTSTGGTFGWSWYPGIPTAIQAYVIYDNCQTASSKIDTWAGTVTAELEKLDPLTTPDGDSTPTITVPSLAADWFSSGGTFEVTYKGGTGSLLAWAETDGTIQDLQSGSSATKSVSFGKGTLSLTACELFEAGKYCATKDLAPEYVTALEGGAMPTVDYKSTFSAGKDGIGSGQVNTLKPCSSGADCTLTDCAEWFIYAKTSSGELMASGFTSTLEWKQELTTYKAYLSCGGGALKTADVATTDLPTVALSITKEVEVGFPACNVEGEEAEPSGTSFLLDDGRNCTCVMGDAHCTAKDTKSVFRLSDGEAVGIALSVSIIVMIILMALIFLCLKKSAQKQELVGVLKSNTNDAVPQDDRL